MCDHNYKSIDYKMGYLMGRLEAASQDLGFEDYIFLANSIIEERDIPFNIGLAEWVCEKWSDTLGFVEIEGKVYLVLDSFDYAVYIDKEEEKLAAVDDEEFVATLKKKLE